ncbi:MAG: amidohydrolase, partial [Opitutae bacterium]|nr:amidohydrolase [Opitutae bacterium]
MNPIHTVRLILSSAILAILAGCCTRHQSGGVDVAIPIIDTHIHLYDTSRPDGVPWPPESDKVLYRPVLSQHFDA